MEKNLLSVFVHSPAFGRRRLSVDSSGARCMIGVDWCIEGVTLVCVYAE